jgi:hypothetical protein
METWHSPLLRPTPGKWVLAAGVNGSGQQVIIRAMWIPQYYMDEGDGDCEEYMQQDDFGGIFWPQGWYEKCESTGMHHRPYFQILKWTDSPLFPGD